MSIPGLSEQDCAEVEQVLKNLPKIERVWVFGSRAKGNFKQGSDVDLALEGVKLDFDTIREASFLLNEESLLPYQFDLVDKNNIESQELKEHIQRKAIVVYEREVDENL